MRFVIVTGMSGAGKSTALKILEDIGYFCVDNLPVPLIPKLAELIRVPKKGLEKLVLGVDIRSGAHLEEMKQVLKVLDAEEIDCKILYMECKDEVLIKRYKETRRTHPLTGKERVDKGLIEERQKIGFLKERADYVLDTSHMLTRELKEELNQIFVQDKAYNNLYITVLSFGFKYGIPADADLVFDVRFLPNPYYEEELRPLTGSDTAVCDYVMQDGAGEAFLEKLEDLFRFLLPKYVKEGKSQMVIGIGCTGGKHRSVAIAGKLQERLRTCGAYGVRTEHRDVEKDRVTKAG